MKVLFLYKILFVLKKVILLQPHYSDKRSDT